ncbi:PilZ domain-containing protein [Pseudomonas syringae]|nr:PilZ domain-containing protein [Pseudomonas syringae]
MSRNDRDYEEKDYIRMRVDADVNLIHAGQVIPAVCIDLPALACRFRRHARSVGDKVDVRIDSDHPALKGLEAETEVVWVNDEEGGGQKLGLSIVSMK